MQAETNDQFIIMAQAIAGKNWPTRLPPLIGKCRTQVWEYANKKREVPQTVSMLMEQLARNVRVASNNV
jgi:hypothetical protein